jgi:hypothetical protein
MICQQFEQLAPQIAHNELRDAKLLQDAMNHAACCAHCDAILVEAREIAVAVGALAAHDKAVDAAGHLEFTLRAAFAREHGVGAVQNVGDRREFQRAGRRPASTTAHVFAGATFNRHVFSLAGAAIIFAILLVPGIVGHKSEPSRLAVKPAQTVAPTVAAVTPADVAAPAQIVAPVAQKHFASSHKPKKNPSERETTLTGFLALPYADDLSTIEYGAIVRLQMSRADLAWYGLPVPISDSGQKITADLFVNGSGTPEAIRLVRLRTGD